MPPEGREKGSAGCDDTRAEGGEKLGVGAGSRERVASAVGKARDRQKWILDVLEGGHDFMMMMKIVTEQYKVPEKNIYTAADSG